MTVRERELLTFNICYYKFINSEVHGATSGNRPWFYGLGAG